MADKFISGFVSILGRPNTGKSTLLNALVESKVAIVADKPQTTRTSIQGVWTSEAAQIVFLDTPGIHRGDSLINRQMMKEVRAALEERDVILFLADASREFQEEDRNALDIFKKVETPRLLVLNKIDRVREKHRLLPLIEKYNGAASFLETIPVSALTGEGIAGLRQTILKYLPEGPAYFPADYLTDQPEKFLASELIREKVLHETRQEVPHAVAVVVDAWEEKRALTRIVATIYVEREGQKAILIGAKGSMLKRIGTAARTEMEQIFGRKIFLELFVKIRANWRESPEFLKDLDWRTMTGER